MRVFITVSEEPVYISPFIKKIISSIPEEIAGVAIQCNTSAVVGKKTADKLKYLLTLAVISDPWSLIKRAFVFCSNLLLDKMKFIGVKNPYSIYAEAAKHNIPVFYCDNVNSPEFIKVLREKSIDVIINQAQVILKKEFLSVPRLGCLNRHAALLPKYRGRLAPFWAYMNREAEVGLSIHFIDEKIDNGPIIIQKRIPIRRFDTVDSLLDRIFRIAPSAMLQALDLIRSGSYSSLLLENDPSQATYYSSPGFKDAVKYRLVMFRRMILGK